MTTKAEQFDSLVDHFTSRMKELLKSKGHDYTSGQDRFSNFRLSEALGVPAWKGVLIRLGDKFSRLCSFAQKGEQKVKDESFEDTCIDLANYAVLLLGVYLEAKKSPYTTSTKVVSPKTAYMEDPVFVYFNKEEK